MISDLLDIDNLKEMCISFYEQSKYRSLTKEIDDIVLTGSFTYGFVRPSSDVDLHIYTEYIQPHKFSHYTLLVRVFYINDRRYSLFITDKKNYDRKFMGFQLPRYSLINKTLTNFNKNDLISYISKKSENKSWLEQREWFDNICNLSENNFDRINNFSYTI